jgi:pyruvate-formate lyase-activating enzyme
MHLADIMALRRQVCAGLLVTTTDRCPLSCAHCSSASTLRGKDIESDQLLRFVGSFTAGERPDVVMLTGGEPLMRPDLVCAVAREARTAGTRTAVLTGAFFARGGRLPAPVREAARTVDHFSISLDAYHEREVSRADVFAVLKLLLKQGTDTSLHIVGTGPDDSYLEDVTTAVSGTFGADVPMLVSEVRPIGRARGWALALADADAGRATPCAMAAWPVVSVDGRISACCNQDVVDGRSTPDHLALGHIATDGWAAVHERARTRPLLRVIRTVGPLHLTARVRGELVPGSEPDYCTSCHRLGDEPAAANWASRIGAGPVGELLERTAIEQRASTGPVGLVTEYGSSRYAHLVDGRAAGTGATQP